MPAVANMENVEIVCTSGEVVARIYALLGSGVANIENLRVIVADDKQLLAALAALTKRKAKP